MNILSRLEYLWGPGLGTGIGLLSTLDYIDRGSPFVIHYSDTVQWVQDLVDALHISEDKVKLIRNPNYDRDHLFMLDSTTLFDGGKFFNPYIDRDEIDLFGKTFKLGEDTKSKKCIGIVMTNGTFTTVEQVETQSYPANKYYPRENYLKIINLAMEAGYDIITLDSNWIDLPSKMYQISQLCDCVIGYEGGIMHLAHVLKTPTIILPWHHLSNGTTPVDFSFFNNPVDLPGLKYATHQYHLDKKTWFLNSVDEILKWNPVVLKSIIELLRKDRGNNIFLKRKLSYFEKESFFRSNFSSFEQCLISKYIGDLHVAGDSNL